MKKDYPNTPILALSATVTAHTLKDSKLNLGISKCEVHRQPCDRPNLKFYVKNLSHIVNKPFQACVDTIKDYILNNGLEGKTGIVYCMTQKETVEMAKALIGEQLLAWYYLNTHKRNKLLYIFFLLKTSVCMSSLKLSTELLIYLL